LLFANIGYEETINVMAIITVAFLSKGTYIPVVPLEGVQTDLVMFWSKLASKKKKGK
jgi:hypothetical protein